MKNGIRRKSLILREHCLKEGEETSSYIYQNTEKFEISFFSLLLSRIACTSLGIIWIVFAAKKFEKSYVYAIIAYVHGFYL